MTFSVNLANKIEFAKINDLLGDDNWCWEQKLDGVRLALLVNEGEVSAINRRGIATVLPDRALAAAFAGTRGQWILDGEWIERTFWIFDLPTAPGVELGTPYRLRRDALDAIVPTLTERTPMIRLLPSHRTPEAKFAIAKWVLEHNAEGLMLKDLRAPYRCGPKRYNTMLKAKLVDTADCVVMEVGREGKQSVSVGLFDGETLIDVGSVKVTDRLLATLKPGDVIEVSYLYATEDRRLYQSQLRGVRSDKLAAECSIGQLKFTDRSVLATPLT